MGAIFTTKGPGRGTGLGLSTVATIVRTHQGFCTLQTEQGRGTTFRIYLPAAASPKPGTSDPFTAPPVRGEGELILLVDDEVPILETVSSILKRGGYQVLTASNGLRAKGIFESRHREIALVITDLDMPELDGAGLVRVIRGSARVQDPRNERPDRGKKRCTV